MNGAGFQINVHSLLAQSLVNGPGRRGVLWVQGCPFDCPGCFNQAARSLEPANRLSLEEICACFDPQVIEGITISGGEPFLQAAALNLLCAEIRRQGLSVMVYSGYTLRQLQEMHDWAVDRLLAQTDILVDGTYKQEIAANHPWSGSGNQQVHFLSGRYSAYLEKPCAQERYTEVTINENGDIVYTGF